MFNALQVVNYNEWNKLSYCLHFTSLSYKIILFKSMLNDRRITKLNQNESKSNLIILAQMCNVTD